MNEMIMVCPSVNNNTSTGLVISLCSDTNPLISLIPRMASNFRRLLSCGTIVYIRKISRTMLIFSYDTKKLDLSG